VLQVVLVSPEKVLYTGEAESVIARTLGGGDIAFLAGHSPFVGALDIGTVTIRTPGDVPDEVVAVHGGFVEVSSAPAGPDTVSGGEAPGSVTQVTILSDVAEMSGQIDVARTEAAKEKAEAAVRDDPTDDEAVAALKRANARLAVVGALEGSSTSAH